jgi:hypothetical protein
MQDKKCSFVLTLTALCCLGASGCIDVIREGAVTGAGNAVEAAVETALSLLALPMYLVAAFLGGLAGPGT